LGVPACPRIPTLLTSPPADGRCGLFGVSHAILTTPAQKRMIRHTMGLGSRPDQDPQDQARGTLGDLMYVDKAKTLPTERPEHKIYAGYGGAPCDACGDPILPAQVEYELNYPDEHRTFRLHLGCAGLWEAMRLQRGLDRAL
jgi:hypothetical protein